MITQNDTTARPREQVHQGPRGAGWFLAAFFVFSIVIFTGWAEGWWDTDRGTTTAAASHRTTGSGNKVQQ